MKNLKLGLLAKELVLFSLIPLLALLASIRYYAAVPVEKMEVSYSIPWFLISFIIAVGLILLLVRFVKSAIPFKILMSLTLFIGSLIIFDAFMPSIYSLATASLLIVLYWLSRTIALHNLVIVISIAGVSTYLGLLLPIMTILILFGLIAVYDIIAVLKTGHMVEMFKSMAERGAVLALVIPEKMKNAGKKVGGINLRKGKREVVFLGTGDAAFPTMLAVAALQLGLYPALGVIIGALLGVVVVHFVLMKLERPLPALPPIALLSAAGYFIGVLI